ncbi:O-methyltransferase [Cellulomonas massiliensis]|uniref:O-methyltransferase n=1 Tax=Cellulomonas massiliensis TaxID=1465811 RepID=UPI000312462D|nr:O-methyltransferase [Cellulomonas massiliensis]
MEETPGARDWTAVDRYFEALVAPDEAVRAAAVAQQAGGLPDIAVAPNQGKLLHLLAAATGARRVLEIGTLGGYSTLWLARALPPDGRVTTLELDPAHAAVARSSFERAGVADRVDVVVGPALASLDAMVEDGTEPFDLAFVDADKENLAPYVERCLALLRPGALIVVDNVVREGAVVDAAHPDPRVQGVRRMVELLTGHPRLDTTVVQTVGTKGWDGFALARVLP